MTIQPPHVPVVQPPSARAVDLGEKFVEFARLARERDPDLTPHEVLQALAMARAAILRGSPFRAWRVVVGVLLAVMAFGSWLAWYLVAGRTVDTPALFGMTVASMIATAIGITLAVRR